MAYIDIEYQRALKAMSDVELQKANFTLHRDLAHHIEQCASDGFGDRQGNAQVTRRLEQQLEVMRAELASRRPKPSPVPPVARPANVQAASIPGATPTVRNVKGRMRSTSQVDIDEDCPPLIVLENGVPRRWRPGDPIHRTK